MNTREILGAQALIASAITARTVPRVPLVFSPVSSHIDADVEFGNLRYDCVHLCNRFVAAIRHREWIFCLEWATSTELSIGAFHANVHYTFAVLSVMPVKEACRVFSRLCVRIVRLYLWNPPPRK